MDTIRAWPISWRVVHVQARGKNRSDSKKCARESLFLLWQPKLSARPPQRKPVPSRKAVRPLHPMSSAPRDRRRLRTHSLDVNHWHYCWGHHADVQLTASLCEENASEAQASADRPAYAFCKRRDPARPHWTPLLRTIVARRRALPSGNQTPEHNIHACDFGRTPELRRLRVDKAASIRPHGQTITSSDWAIIAARRLRAYSCTSWSRQVWSRLTLMVNEEDNPNRTSSVRHCLSPVPSHVFCRGILLMGQAPMRRAQRAVGNTLLVGHPNVIA